MIMEMTESYMKGVYLLEGIEGMPCMPRALNFPHFALNDTLGNPEAEEIAARIIYFSQKVGFWAGVSYDVLFQMLNEEHQIREKYECEQYWLGKWQKKNRFTLGLYGWFRKKPDITVLENPPIAVLFPLDIMCMGNAEGFSIFWDAFTAINWLENNGFAKVCFRGENDEERVVYPLPALIKRVAQKWGVVSYQEKGVIGMMA